MRLARLVLPSVVCVASAACSPTFDWREARPADGLGALFPCKPDRHARAVMLAELPVTMRMSSCSTGDHTFAVSEVEAADVAQVTPLMQALRAALVANVAGSAAGAAAPLAAASVPGATPHPLAQRLAVSGRRGNGEALQAQGQFFCQGLRVYQATVVGQHLDAAVLDVFFASLKLPS